MAGLLFVLFIGVPQPNLEFKTKPIENYLLDSWFGEVSLSWVFWPFFLVLNVSLLTADLLAKAGTITVSSWDEIHFALVLPIVWWTVSVWRCSNTPAAKIWSALARLTTIAVFIEYGLKLLIRIDYPRIYFNCEEVLLNYGSCF